MRMLSKSLLLGVLGTSVTAAPRSSSIWGIGQTVPTTSGIVQGHAATWPGNEAVSEYLGIPYAAPPLGDLRFAPPTRFTPNSTTFDANPSPAVLAYGEAMGGGLPGQPHTYSENCLSVNVWTKPQTGELAKAVMVWIYGGGKLLPSETALHTVA